MNPQIGHLVLMQFLGDAFFSYKEVTLVDKHPFSCTEENLQLLFCNITQRKDD